jgi:hypothetical protein
MDSIVLFNSNNRWMDGWMDGFMMPGCAVFLL